MQIWMRQISRQTGTVVSIRMLLFPSDDKERSGQDGTAAEVTSEEIKTENHEEETPAEKTAG